MKLARRALHRDEPSPPPREGDRDDPSAFSHDWEPGTAKIVAKKFKEGGERSGVWEYVADVTLAAGEVFRTTLTQPPFMSHVVWLEEGEIADVLVDVALRRDSAIPPHPERTGRVDLRRRRHAAAARPGVT